MSAAGKRGDHRTRGALRLVDAAAPPAPQPTPEVSLSEQPGLPEEPQLNGLNVGPVTVAEETVADFKVRLMETILQNMKDRTPPVLIISGILVDCGVDQRAFDAAFSTKGNRLVHPASKGTLRAVGPYDILAREAKKDAPTE